MAQTSGWLIIGPTRFERMPFLASVKEAKFRSFVTPGTTLSDHGEAGARGLRLRGDRGRGRAPRASRLQRQPVVPASMPFPNPDFRAQMEELADRLAFPMEALAHG